MMEWATLPLLASVLVILLGLVIDRVWQFRKNNRKDKQDNLALFELKIEIASLINKIENQSALMNKIIQDLSERITKIEIKLGA